MEYSYEKEIILFNFINHINISGLFTDLIKKVEISMSKSKFKAKDKVLLARGMQSGNVEETVHRVLNFALVCFENEGFDSESAYREANKVVFGFANDFISGNTIAQWLAHGGDERKAYDAVKDYIIEAKKVVVVQREIKTITARVFKGGG